MAIVELKPIKLTAFNTFVTETANTDFIAIDATAGAFFEMPKGGDKFVIGITNAAATAVNKTLTIKAGNALQGVNDISVTLAQNAIAWITIDSGRFKNVYGDDRGKVIMTGTDANLKVKVIQLP